MFSANTRDSAVGGVQGATNSFNEATQDTQGSMQSTILVALDNLDELAAEDYSKEVL